MSSILAVYISVGLWASAIILALLLLRRFFSQKLSAGFFRLAWLCLAVRLVIPFDISLPKAPVVMSMPQLYTQSAQPELQSTAPYLPAENVTKTKYFQSGSITAEYTQRIKLEPNVQTPVNEEPLFTVAKVKEALPYLWLGVAIVYFLHGYLSYIVFCMQLRKSRISTPRLQNSERAPKLYISEHVKTPVLCGFLRPAIYLPNKSYTEKELESITAHELIHFKNKDLWLQLLLLAAASLSWFNPLVHIMRRKAIFDIEMNVDEKLLKSVSFSERVEYGKMLFKELAEIEMGGKLMAHYNSGKNTKERFKAILNTAAKSRGRALLGLVMAVCLGASLLVACVPKVQQNGSSQSPVASLPSSSADETQSEASSSMDASSDASLPQSSVQQFPESTSFALPLGEAYLKLSRTHLVGEDEPYIAFDMIAPLDTPVYAVMDGVIAETIDDKIAEKWGYGIYANIDHGGDIITSYQHLSELTVKKGDEVKKGDVIGYVGLTGRTSGPHLHFEIQTADDAAIIKYIAKEMTIDNTLPLLETEVYGRELTEDETELWKAHIESLKNVLNGQ